MHSSHPDVQAPLLFRFPSVAAGEESSVMPADEAQQEPIHAPEPTTVSAEAQVAEAALSESVYQDGFAPTTAYIPAEPEPVVHTSAVEADFDSKTQTDDLADSEESPTWWEHWSSGIVLVLLIVALVTASVIAFNDQSATDDDLLAIEESRNAVPEDTDLTQLDIPLDTGTTESTSPAVPELAINADAASNMIPDIDAPMLGSTATTQQPLQPQSPIGNQGYLLGGTGQSAPAADANSLVLNEEIEQALSQATLGMPEQKAARPMFNDSTASGTPDTNMPPLESMLGVQPEATVGTGMPPLLTLTGNQTLPNHSTHGVGATTVSHAVPVGTPSSSNVQPAVRQTLTPESDEQELLRRFQEWRKSEQMNSTSTSTPTFNQPNTGAAPAGYPPN